MLTSLIKITRIKHPEQMLASAPAPPKAHHAEGLFRSLVYEARCQWPLKYGDGNGFNPGPVDGWGGGGSGEYLLSQVSKRQRWRQRSGSPHHWNKGQA